MTYTWTDNPTVSGIAQCDTDILNDDLMYLKDETDDINTALTGKADVDLANVNDSGTSLGASWAFPSDTYENLTFGASGTTYTAPANGYVYFSKIAGYGGAGINLTSSDTGITSELIAYAATDALALWLPVQKGEVFSVNYSATGALVSLIFIYAQGSESEAS